MDAGRWLKTGIEFVDGAPKLSCVVTNTFSDWSTQRWDGAGVTFGAATGADGAGSAACQISLRLRLHKIGDSIVVEACGGAAAAAAEEGDGGAGPDWQFVRICHLDQRNVGAVQMGVFACCPARQAGCSAVFHSMSIAAGSSFSHNADGNV